jgi:hypothetical protein
MVIGDGSKQLHHVPQSFVTGFSRLRLGSRVPVEIAGPVFRRQCRRREVWRRRSGGASPQYNSIVPASHTRHGGSMTFEITSQQRQMIATVRALAQSEFKADALGGGLDSAGSRDGKVAPLDRDCGSRDSAVPALVCTPSTT